MKKLLISAFIAASFIASAAANAAMLSAAWTDPTPTTPAGSYAPTYYAEYRVEDASGNLVVADVVKSSIPSFTASIAATTANVVKVRYRADNVIVPSYPITGPWSEWHTAKQAITPVEQVPTVTIFAY